MVKTKAARRRHLVKALRSGKYTKGKGCLEAARDQVGAAAGSNCCLGVACRVAIEDGLNIAVTVGEIRVEFDGESGVLPPSVMDWYGFATPLGNYERTGNYSRMSLVAANDDASKMPFEEIADIIEAEPEGLFVD